jgi:uncharacterized secreted protein with C-terminal beta-propeller domain
MYTNIKIYLICYCIQLYIKLTKKIKHLSILLWKQAIIKINYKDLLFLKYCFISSEMVFLTYIWKFPPVKNILNQIL